MIYGESLGPPPQVVALAGGVLTFQFSPEEDTRAYTTYKKSSKYTAYNTANARALRNSGYGCRCCNLKY